MSILWPNGCMDHRYHLVIKTEVDLSPGDTVLDGDPAPPSTQMGTAAPLFGPLLWPASPQAHILPVARIVDQAVCGGRLPRQYYG